MGPLQGLERGLLLEIFGLEAAPSNLPVREPPPEPKPFVPAPRPEPVTEIPPDIDALIDVLVAGWKAEAASPKGAEAEPELEAG